MKWYKNKILLIITLHEIISLSYPFIASILVQQLIEEQWNTFLYCVLLLLALPVIEGFIFKAKETELTMWTEGNGVKLRKRMLSKVLRAPYLYFSTTKTGEVITRFTEDTRLITENQRLSLEMFRNILAFFVVIGLFLFQNWILIFIILGNITFYTIVNKILLPKIQKNATENLKQIDKLNEYLRERIKILPLTRFSGATRWEVNKYRGMVEEEFTPLLLKLSFTKFMSSLLTGIGQTLSVLLLYGVCGWLIVKGDINLGQLIMVTGYTFRLSTISVELLNWYQKKVGADLSKQRTQQILQIEIEESQNSEHVIESIDTIELRNINFNYPGNDNVYTNLNAKIYSGEIVALVGSSGCGKTTLANILLGNLKLKSGDILLNNSVPLHQINLGVWRSRIGYSPQFPYFFTDSIESNLRYGREDINSNIIEDYSHKLDMHTVIKGRSQGYQTEISEKEGFSGGQRQRLGLIRTFVTHEDNPLLYILDEPTAFLDSFTESKVMAIVSKLKHKAPVLLIAHRLSTVIFADRILVMEKGEIVEEGTHDQLLANKNFYWNMYQQELDEVNQAN